MYIYILTTDGGDREDGNVYYARFIVTDKPALAQIAALVDGRITKKGDIMVPQWFKDEEDGDHPFDDVDSIMDELGKMGIKCDYPQPHFVVRKGE